ncbi:MAG: hypothetical protein AAGE76_13285 [Pseudomonadota bacterium]
MPIAVFFVVLTGSVAIALLYPHLRVVAIVIAAFCAALIGFIAVDRVGEVGRAADRISVEDITLSEVALSFEPRYMRMTGRAANASNAHQLREFTVQATLRDCPAEDSAADECAVIGQETGIARVDIPPGQVRPFAVVLGFSNGADAPEGLRWNFDILSARASE